VKRDLNASKDKEKRFLFYAKIENNICTFQKRKENACRKLTAGFASAELS